MPKLNIQLKYKKQISEKTFYLIYQTDQDIDLKPGQFLSLEVQPKTMRPYSIVEIEDVPKMFFEDINFEPIPNSKYLSLMISTKPGGVASQYIENTKVGDQLMAVGPAGRFRLKETSLNKIFIATGTGLAPFMAMIDQNIKLNPNQTNKIYFAAWDLSQAFASKFTNSYSSAQLKLINVVEDAQSKANNQDVFEGRVTTVIPELENNLQANEYYLCGHPGMVSAMEKVLLENQVPPEQIIMEKFA